MKKILVIAYKYGRGDGGDIEHIIYEGKDEKKIWIDIADKHGYGVDEDDAACMDVQQIIDSIEEQNGDGCDYITAIDISDVQTNEDGCYDITALVFEEMAAVRRNEGAAKVGDIFMTYGIGIEVEIKKVN